MTRTHSESPQDWAPLCALTATATAAAALLTPPAAAAMSPSANGRPDEESLVGPSSASPAATDKRTNPRAPCVRHGALASAGLARRALPPPPPFARVQGVRALLITVLTNKGRGTEEKVRNVLTSSRLSRRPPLAPPLNTRSRSMPAAVRHTRTPRRAARQPQAAAAWAQTSRQDGKKEKKKSAHTGPNAAVQIHSQDRAFLHF